MFERITKIIVNISSVIFVIIVALILLFLFGYRTEVSYTSPVWSKDGSRIYYVKNVDYSNRGIYLASIEWYTFKLKSYIMSMCPDGSRKRVVAKYIRHIEKKPPLGSIKNLAILPNDKELIFFIWAPGVETLNIAEESGIYKINTDGTNLTKLLGFEKITKYPELFVSPDGTKIAYTKERYEPHAYPDQYFSSWIMDADGQNNQMVYGENSSVYGWIEDCKLIITMFGDSEGNIKPTRPSYDYEKKEWITYEDDIGPKILVYDISSKKPIKVIPRKGYTSKEDLLKIKGFSKVDETISPDGKKRLFVGDETGSIYIEDIDGKNKKTLLKGKTH